MKNRLKDTIIDYFLILSAIIGVGFASGKEICIFFFDFSGNSLIGLLAFAILYVYLFLVLAHIKNKLRIKSYDEFNSMIFGKLSKLTDFVMLVNFSITCAGMISGADYMFQTFFNFKYKVVGIIMSGIILLLLIGGINKIKTVANIIIPIMLTIIVVNSIQNITPSNVNLNINIETSHIALYYGLLFGVNNFVAALPVLFSSQLKTKGRMAVIITICLIILLNILVLASNEFSTDMPMFELSQNLGKSFYYIYFITLIFALFSTLMICSYNMQTILSKGQKSIFVAVCVVVLNYIISCIGYSFIVKYLYVVSGIISGIYVFILIIIITMQLIKHKHLK